MKKIPLNYGKITLVDDDDYEKYKHIKWYAWHRKGSIFYAKNSGPSINGKQYPIFLHQLIMSTPKGMVTDHINHDTLDNRKDNLRICTQSQNRMNLIGAINKSKSGILGVHAHGEKWEAKIKYNGLSKYLGIFSDKKSAQKIYLKARKKYFGKFA